MATLIARMAVLLIGILIVLLSPKLAKSQPHAFDQYTVEDGLPSNYVYRIVEDELGYLWAATENGLARFDGYEWKSYGLADGLTGLDIYSMTTLPGGGIICGGNGMQPMLISKGDVRPFKLLADTLEEVSYQIMNTYPPLVSINSDTTTNGDFRYVEVFSSDSIVHHIQSRSNNYGLWVYCYFNGGQFLEKMKNNISDLVAEQKFVYCFKGVLGVEKGACLVGAKILYHDSVLRGDLTALFDGGYSLTAGSVDRGVLQIWKNDSLFIFKDIRNVQRVGFDLFSNLFDVNVGMKSRIGDYWLATRSSGVIRISKQAQQVRTISGTNNVSVEGLASTTFGLLVADDNSNLYEYSNGFIAPYSDFNTTKAQSRFKCLATEISGDTAIFIRHRKRYLVSSKGIEQLVIPSDFFDVDSGVDVDSIGYLLNSMNQVTRFPSFIIGGGHLIYYIDENEAKVLGRFQPHYSILQPSHENAKGVHVIDQHRLLFVEEGAKVSTRWSTDTLSITEGFELDSNRFLLGTSDKGVYLLNLSEDSVSCTHLFSCAPVKKIKVINGECWAATYSGVYRFSESGIIDLHLDKNSGLLTNETYDVDQTGDSILIATAKGLAAIPKGMRKVKGHTVDSLFVTWQNMRVDGVSRKVEGRALRLSPREDNLELDFTLLHPNLDGNIEYEVQLSPIDEQPRLQRERSVRYASLPPGEYKLYINAILEDGSSYSLENPLQIQLLAPLWKRPWFLFLCATVFCVGVYTFASRRAIEISRRQQQEQISLRRNSELQLEALRSQMNPHFIFNALGSIQYFIQTEAKDKADEYLGRFAKLMRSYLEGSKRNLTPLSDEVDMLTQYLKLECMRASNNFSYKIVIDPRLSEHQLIPSMLLQPLVENAVLHGLSVRKDGKSHISITIAKSGDKLLATVSDNGQGFINSKKHKRRGHRSRATGITQERVEALRHAGVAEVKIQYQENSSELPVESPERITFPGTIVSVSIQNIQNHVQGNNR